MGDFNVRLQSVHVRGGVEIEFLKAVRKDGQERFALDVITGGYRHRVHFDCMGRAHRVEMLPLTIVQEEEKV